MVSPESAEPASTPARQRHEFVVAAAIINGLSGYVILLVAARTLSPEENAHFLVFWGALFASFGVLVGIAAEVTRAVHAAAPRAQGVRAARVTLGFGLVAAVTIGATAPGWSGPLFGDDALEWTALAVVAVVLFSVHAVIVGISAGRERWTTYAFLVGVEPLARLALVGLVIAVAGGQRGLAAATALATGYWVILVVVRRPDLGWKTRVDADWRGLTSRLVSACSASAATAVLLVGFPVLVRVSTGDAEFATAAPLILAVSLCRAPLMVPLGVYQSVIITRVIVRGTAALRVPIQLVSAATVVGVVSAWAVGPWCLRVINPEYVVGRWTFAALVFSAGLVCFLTLSGAASLALDRHRLYVMGWVGASAMATALLFLPGSLTARTIVALLVGPLVGIGIHAIGLRWGSTHATQVASGPGAQRVPDQTPGS